jgi:hypothetical protein
VFAVLAMSAASATTVGGTGATSSALAALARPRKEPLYLMDFAMKLRFGLNALRRAARTHPSRRWPRPSPRGDPMDEYKLVVFPTAKWTRLLLTLGPDELLRAILPSPPLVRHARAATTLLEGLSMWLDTALPVVLSADDEDFGFRLNLTDEMGLGAKSLYYHVEVAERARRQRRGKRIRGVADFSDLRQLRLVTDGDAKR